MSEIAVDPQHPSCLLEIAEVWSWAYRTCHHVELIPQPQKGQRYRVTGHLDLSGRCPRCTEERAAEKAAQKASKR